MFFDQENKKKKKSICKLFLSENRLTHKDSFSQYILSF